jgi:co-chaperonin GroES (HSP10)
MAGFIALGNNQYLGTLKNTTANLENGMFVVADFTAGTAAVPASASAADDDVWFVVNEIETISEQGIDDVDYKIAVDKFLRLHYPQKGEVLVTTNYKGTPVKGDVLAVGDGGTVEAVGTRTPKIKFVVDEVTTAYGTTALKLVVL